MGRVGQVLAERRGVFLVLLEQGAAHLAHGAEYVEVGVGDGGQGGPEDEDDERHRVGGHSGPVQVADEGLRVKVRLGVAGGPLEERRAAGQHRRQPREDDPALAARRRLHRLVAQRLADGQVAVHRYPHERVDGHGPQSRLHVTRYRAQHVTESPAVRQRRVDGQRDHQEAGQQVGSRQADQIVVHHFATFLFCFVLFF